ncbi:MAG TPA: hypothetical protein VIY72_12150, partial [Acidimicrobiales bacterium]
MTTNHTGIERGPRARLRTARAVLAATIVLVLGAGALLAACGTESPGPSGSGGDSRYLLPPEGAD